MVVRFKKPKKLKMSKKSERALDKCIEHWHRVRDKFESSTGEECKLCQLYSCSNCPVGLKSGNGCHTTPYYKYRTYIRSAIKNEPRRKRLAQKEIDFLQTCYY